MASRPGRMPPSQARGLALSFTTSLGVHQKGDDQAVQTQDFGENENENLGRLEK
jgi:hypothetical protein